MTTDKTEATPRDRETCTMDGAGRLLTIDSGGVSMPADYTFALVNDYVHSTGRHFEELQYLALGMAGDYEALQARVADLEAAEEAAKEVFGHVVDDKERLSKRVADLEETAELLRGMLARGQIA